MDDRARLTERAKELRARIAAFLAEFGDVEPKLRLLHDELAQIESHLHALGEHGPDIDAAQE